MIIIRMNFQGSHKAVKTPCGMHPAVRKEKCNKKKCSKTARGLLSKDKTIYVASEKENQERLKYHLLLLKALPMRRFNSAIIAI